MILELISKMAGDALGNLADDMVKQAANGEKNYQPDKIQYQKLQMATNQEKKQAATMPIKTGDTSLAGTISADVQKMKPDNGQIQNETEEGKMGYPAAYSQKKDRDPRHPNNKGVSANPGFVGA